MKLLLESNNKGNIDGRKVDILGNNGSYIAIMYPGRSVYVDAVNGTQYEPARIMIGELTTDFGEENTIYFNPILEFNLRKG